MDPGSSRTPRITAGAQAAAQPLSPQAFSETTAQPWCASAWGQQASSLELDLFCLKALEGWSRTLTQLSLLVGYRNLQRGARNEAPHRPEMCGGLCPPASLPSGGKVPCGLQRVWTRVDMRPEEVDTAATPPSRRSQWLLVGAPGACWSPCCLLASPRLLQGLSTVLTTRLSRTVTTPTPRG